MYVRVLTHSTGKPLRLKGKRVRHGSVGHYTRVMRTDTLCKSATWHLGGGMGHVIKYSPHYFATPYESVPRGLPRGNELDTHWPNAS